MVRWSGLIVPILVIITIIIGLLSIGFGSNYAINLVQKSRLEAKVQIQQNLIDQYRTDVVYRDTRMEEYLSLLSKSQEDLLRSHHLLDEVKRDLDSQKQFDAHALLELNESQLQLTQEKDRVDVLEEEVNQTAVSLRKLLSLHEFAVPLTQDRLLLIELRKDIPDARNSANSYLEQLKKLGVTSDPSLGPKVDRIIRLLPTYFDWYEKEYDTLGEEMAAYINSGAVDFNTAHRDFEKDALHVVVKRIDAVINQLD